MIDRYQTTTVEVIAPTVEEAIENGLADLSLPREAVEVEILDKGRHGFLGVGTRQVRVKLIVKNTALAASFPISPLIEISPEVAIKSEPALETAFAPDLSSSRDELKQVDDSQIIQEATSILETILKLIKINASVKASFRDKTNNTTDEYLLSSIQGKFLYLNITGNDLSILIGRQAENLQAIQLLTSLIVNKKMGRSVPLIIDVEGYRERRKNQLLQIAHRMAEQAVKTGRRQALEPMAAEDRRLIHIGLRDHPTVYTESIGEEPRRKVTIVPK